MGGDKGKKLKVDEENNNSDHIDEKLVLSIEKLQEMQDELEKINEEASDKVMEIEQRYSEIRRPIYAKRDNIIKDIPDFWLTAFVSHPALAACVTTEDQQIIKYMESLEVEDFKDVKTGYSITFNFKPNPYFENTKLTKTYTFLDEGPTKITGTSIKWKEGMGIPNGVADEKKGKKRHRGPESFFTWFSDSESRDEDMDEMQDDLAEVIKEDLWPNPLTYFNIEADDMAAGADDDEEQDDDDEEDDDEEDDEDDDDDEGAEEDDGN